MRKIPSCGQGFALIARRLWLAAWLVLSLAFPARAHICGPSTLVIRPGDLTYYYILSDVFETSPSGYQLNSISDTNVVSVSPTTPFSAYYYGEFAIKALKEGDAYLRFHWSYVPFNASGDCTVHVIVTKNVLLASVNYPQSAFSGDPVNAYTGGLAFSEPPDLDLGGPMDLRFQRYYDSRLDGSLLIRSTLGINWSHNFDTRIVRMGDRIDLVNYRGARSQFLKTNGVWQSLHGPSKSFQVIEKVSGGTTNIVIGNRRSNLIYTFNPSGELISIADGKGNVHTLTYTNNSLVQVSDGLGRTITFTVDGFQQLSSVSDGTRTVSFTHNFDESTPLLLSANDAMSGATTYAYDPSNAIPGLLTSKTLPRGNTPYTQVYDSLGRVIQQIVLGVHTNTFAYGAGSTTIANPLGYTRTYAHNTNGALTAYTDEAKQTVGITLNGNGQRAAITDRTGHQAGFAYDAVTGKISAVTNANGAVTQFAYTNYTVSGITFYALSKITLPDGTTEQFVYDKVGNVISHTDRGGNTWKYTYNNHGQALTITNPRGGVVTLTYNPDGTLASSRDSDTGVTTYDYDSLRRLAQIVYPDGATNSAQLDANSRVTRTTDGRGNSYQYRYDANGNVTNIVDPNSAILQFAYDALDRVTNSTDRLGHSESVAYDALNHVASYTDKNGNTTSFAYDARGRRTAITNAMGKVWSFNFNPEGNLLSVTNPLQHAWWNQIDASGFITGRTNPLQNAWHLVRDSMERVTDFVDALGNTTHFDYGGSGSGNQPVKARIVTSSRAGHVLVSESVQRVGEISLIRDSLGSVKQLRDLNGQSWFFGTTIMGRPASVTTPLGVTTTYNLDTSGRNVRTVFADGSTLQKQYDLSGNLTDIQGSDGTHWTRAYDNLNRLIGGNGVTLQYDAERHPINVMSWGVNFGTTFDAGGRPTTMTYNDNAFTLKYQWNALNLLTLATNPTYNAWVRFQWDAASHLTEIDRANGVNTFVTRDNAEQMTRLRHVGQQGTIADLQYQRNALGRPTQIQWTGAGDPTAFTLPSLNLSYNAASQIGNSGFHYDLLGRLTGGGAHSYLWNARWQLSSADGVTYGHNLFNWATRTQSGQTTWNFYNPVAGPNRIAGVYNVTTMQYMRYNAWMPNWAPAFSVNALDSSVSYPLRDGAGSTIALTGNSGNVTDTYSYGPYGSLLNHNGTSSWQYLWRSSYGLQYDFTSKLYKGAGSTYSPDLKSSLLPNLRFFDLSNPQRGLYSPRAGDFQDPMDSAWDSHGAGPYIPTYTRSILIPWRKTFGIGSVSEFRVGRFLRTYNLDSGPGGWSFGGRARGSDTLASIIRVGGSPDDDCCCCDCCCDDGYGGAVNQLGSVRFAFAGVFVPNVRQTSVSRYLRMIGEAYRKFARFTVISRPWAGGASFTRNYRVSGLLPPSRAVLAIHDFKQERIFRNFNINRGAEKF